MIRLTIGKVDFWVNNIPLRRSDYPKISIRYQNSCKCVLCRWNWLNCRANCPVKVILFFSENIRPNIINPLFQRLDRRLYYNKIKRYEQDCLAFNQFLKMAKYFIYKQKKICSTPVSYLANYADIFMQIK